MDNKQVEFGDPAYNWDPVYVCQSNIEAVETIWAFAEAHNVNGYDLEAIVIGQDQTRPANACRYTVYRETASLMGVVSVLLLGSCC
jgi:hypothetical protein